MCLQTGDLLENIRAPAPVTCLIANGISYFAAGLKNGKIYLNYEKVCFFFFYLNMKCLQRLVEIKGHTDSPITCITYYNDIIITGSTDCYIKSYDVKVNSNNRFKITLIFSQTEKNTSVTLSDPVYSLTVNNNTLFIGTNNKAIVWGIDKLIYNTKVSAEISLNFKDNW